MPKSLHHCCRIYCSLDAEITALVVTENTALLVTVHNRHYSLRLRLVFFGLELSQCKHFARLFACCGVDVEVLDEYFRSSL